MQSTLDSVADITTTLFTMNSAKETQSGSSTRGSQWHEALVHFIKTWAHISVKASSYVMTVSLQPVDIKIYHRQNAFADELIFVTALNSAI